MSDAAAAPTRSDRRRERTRAQLLDAGRQLIAERGVAGLRVAQVTEAADVGRGSFYNHFDGLDALVSAIVTASLEELAAIIMEAAERHSDPATAAAVADRRFLRSAEEDPGFARLVANLDNGDEVFSAAVAPHIRRIADLGVASGVFVVPDLDATLTAVVGSTMATVRAMLAGTAAPESDRVHAELMLRLFGLSREDAERVSREALP